VADKRFQLKVITPGKTVFDQQIDFMIVRTADGDMGILHGHEPCSVTLDFGVLRAFEQKRQTAMFAVLGGFVTVRGNQVVVLTAFAEPPDQVEAALAAIEKERAENRIHEQKLDLEVHRAESALRRTLVQMDIGAYSLLKGNEEKQGSGSDEEG